VHGYVSILLQTSTPVVGSAAKLIAKLLLFVKPIRVAVTVAAVRSAVCVALRFERLALHENNVGILAFELTPMFEAVRVATKAVASLAVSGTVMLDVFRFNAVREGIVEDVPIVRLLADKREVVMLDVVILELVSTGIIEGTKETTLILLAVTLDTDTFDASTLVKVARVVTYTFEKLLFDDVSERIVAVKGTYKLLVVLLVAVRVGTTRLLMVALDAFMLDAVKVVTVRFEKALLELKIL
jgi:hypothetical protein